MTVGASAYTAPDKPLAPASQPTPKMSKVGQYEKFEASFAIPGQQGNPFDPDVNRVDAVFLGPKKILITVPAFWDGNVWKVRFAPEQPGRYTLSIQYNGKPIKPSALTSASFTCTPSKEPGFVHLDPQETQRFIFDNGTGYFPIGLNQAWTSHDLPDYPGMFSLMHDSHLNYARVWMTFWDNKALDWAARREDNPKFGEYYLPAARRMDMLMDSAAANGIYVQMCLQHHGQYTAKTDPNWKDNPANAANGGYLQNPQDFFTDSTARKLTRAKYRYIVARWGYSTHLLSYELFNEVQNIVEARSNFDAVGRWHKEMADVIRAVDYPHHLITTSTADDVLKHAGMDYDQVHIYASDIRSSISGVSSDRPVFVGEYGPGGGNWGYDNMSRQVLHDGLWAGVTTPTAGGAQFWYWDVVYNQKWWPELKSVADFYTASGATAQTHMGRLHPHFVSTGALGDLVFPLPGEWKSFSQSDVDVLNDGSSPDMGGVSCYIQGTNHHDMMSKPLSFHVNSPSGTTFRAAIEVAAAGGAHAVLLLDGAKVGDIDYPRGDGDKNVKDVLSVDVPAGKHVVSLENTGFDWYKVSTITLTHYAPATPYAIHSKGNDEFALFWIYPMNGEAQPAAQVDLAVPTVKDGKYALHFWSTAEDKALGAPESITVSHGVAAVSIPEVKTDLAGWISASM